MTTPTTPIQKTRCELPPTERWVKKTRRSIMATIVIEGKTFTEFATRADYNNGVKPIMNPYIRYIRIGDVVYEEEKSEPVWNAE